MAGLAGVADDPTFATNRARVTGRQTLLPLIEEAFLKHTTGWWLDELAKVGVPAGPINPIDAALAEPQAVHRRLSMKIPDDLTGSVPGIASPLRLAATPPKASMPPPRLGAHSRDVLKDLLSMEESRIESLLSDGIIDEPR